MTTEEYSVRKRYVRLLVCFVITCATAVLLGLTTLATLKTDRLPNGYKIVRPDRRSCVLVSNDGVVVASPFVQDWVILGEDVIGVLTSGERFILDTRNNEIVWVQPAEMQNVFRPRPVKFLEGAPKSPGD